MKSLRESLLCKNQFLTEECILHQKRFTQVMAIEGKKKKNYANCAFLFKSRPIWIYQKKHKASDKFGKNPKSRYIL